MVESTWEERICLAYKLQFVIRGSQGKKLKAGTQTQITEEHCLLLTPYGLLILFSYTTQDYLSRSGTTYSGLPQPQHQSLTKKMSPKSCIQASLMEAITQESSPKYVELCVKLTKNSNQIIAILLFPRIVFRLSVGCF